MGTFFRAMIGFAIALTLLHGQAIWSGVNTPSVANLRSDIAATHPAARMELSLGKLMAIQNGTAPRK